QLHPYYVLKLFQEAEHHLSQLPNINRISTCYSEEITVCGDLHGQIFDLFHIFYKNGLPSPQKLYVFNGDFVDRGKHSIEILIILFVFLLIYPKEVHLNRGNHEDYMINFRYGFTKEVTRKYKDHANRLLAVIKNVFSSLPLATVIDRKVLIVHGGISDKTDLEQLAKVERCKVVDILWSDPDPRPGCTMNLERGGGCYFGPDVTDMFLQKHRLQFIIRSHECKPEGYEFNHNRKVITIFSASNYYAVGSNRGAYIKLGPDLIPHLVQFQATKGVSRQMNITQRSASTADSCLITINDWAKAIESVLQLGLPWRMLRPHLILQLTNGKVDYRTWLKDIVTEEKSATQERLQSSLLESIYRNLSNLETIFSLIDTDCS
ncbi:serine/threonine-protein phosphatase with EF-hands 2-like, partial [Protobothrops mucrosquamatus]|uniref:serine/threonine-protein phosphatase with EF-hands 2-like n=1 Tax=Protobothrops mucrosquamatus TaxID=103944 RepID=UPI000775ACFD